MATISQVQNILEKAKKGQWISLYCDGNSTSFVGRVVSLSPLKLGSIKIEDWTEGWEPTPPGPQDPGPLCFTANEADATVKLVGYDYDEEAEIPIWCNLQYSTDNKTTWNAYTGQTVNLNSCINSKVFFRADPSNPNINGLAIFDTEYEYISKWHYFVIDKSVSASGNIQYLLTSDGTRTDVPLYCYYHLFYNCTSLTTAPQFPATSLDKNCYFEMFMGCTTLTSAPELPAKTLAEACYAYMFYGCESLTTAYDLEAETLATECYAAMFNGCKTLGQAPKLLATTLAPGCYYDMFADCEKFNAVHMKTSVEGTYSASQHGNTTKEVIYDL